MFRELFVGEAPRGERLLLDGVLRHAPQPGEAGAAGGRQVEAGRGLHRGSLRGVGVAVVEAALQTGRLGAHTYEMKANIC